MDVETINTGDKQQTHLLDFIEPDLCEKVATAKVCHSIRPRRQVRVNDRLLLVRHKGTPWCRRLRTTHAHAVTPVYVSVTGILLDNTLLPTVERDATVHRLGFDDFNALLAYLRTHVHLPIEGQLIEWL